MNETAITRRVVKVGGSLLSAPDVIERFRAWLVAQPSAETLLIAGGGELADAVRDMHSRRPLSDSVAHWLCIRAMQLQTEMLAAELSEAGIARSVAELRDARPTARLVIVDPWRFIHDDDPRFSTAPLPESWDVTSDSIAARLAHVTTAAELVLLKSATAPMTELQQLSAADYVDGFFSQAARGLPHIRLVNLRENPPVEVVI